MAPFSMVTIFSMLRSGFSILILMCFSGCSASVSSNSAPHANYNSTISLNGYRLEKIAGGSCTIGAPLTWIDPCIKEGYTETECLERGQVLVEVPIQMTDYYLGKYEVTREQYAGCIAAGACDVTVKSECMELNPFKEEGQEVTPATAAASSKLPVTCVSWFQAEKFCKWIGAELPTQSQWEYASRCRAGESFFWPWGNDNETANKDRFSLKKPMAGDPLQTESSGPEKTLRFSPEEIEALLIDAIAPVYHSSEELKQAFIEDGPWPVDSYIRGGSLDGVFGLAGNVAEWTKDGAAFERHWTGCPNLCRAIDIDAETHTEKFMSTWLKGGSWRDDSPDPSTIFARQRTTKNRKADFIGFRCARTSL